MTEMWAVLLCCPSPVGMAQVGHNVGSGYCISLKIKSLVGRNECQLESAIS